MDCEDEDSSKEEEDYEPQVTSNNPAERKLARKLRIQRRVEALRRQNETEAIPGEAVEAEPEPPKSPIQQQVERSADFLEKILIEGEEYVSNIRIANEAREADRRERLGFGKEKLLAQLEEEAAAAADSFSEIANKWTNILKYNDPLHINEDIIAQKEKCDDLIKQKDAIITTLKSELRMAEINFASDQRKQMEDVNSLARRIENQISVMRKAYRQELVMIEDVILAERQLMIEANNKKWDELAKKRDQEEKANADKKSEEYWNFVKDMDVLNRDFQELYRETNIKLENDCDELQREFERIKTDALVNSEKLDYNYQILKKREDENLIIRSQQKRRINKLQDVINNLRKKINSYQTQTQLQSDKLTEEVKKLSGSVLDIEKKADHMARVNNIRFEQIWDMNKKRADVLINRILEIDRMLHEQQLGIPWIPPEQKIMEKNELESYKAAVKSLGDTVKKREITPHLRSGGNKQTMLENKNETANYRKIIRNILSLIADKTGFLIEDQLSVILEPYLEQEKTLIKVDNVFSALNVKDKTDIDLLLTFFLPYMYCPLCNVQTDDSSDTNFNEESLLEVHDMEHISFMDTPKTTNNALADLLNTSMTDVLGTGTQVDVGPLSIKLFDKDLDGECKGPPLMEDTSLELEQNSGDSFTGEGLSCQYHHPLMISSVYVLRALKEFLTRYHMAKASVPTMSARLTHVRSTVSRLVAKSDIELFWRRFTEIFTVESEQLWDSLLEGLKKYHVLLKARKNVSEEVVSLRRQNVELRRLFANYIDKKPLPY